MPPKKRGGNKPRKYELVSWGQLSKKQQQQAGKIVENYDRHLHSICKRLGIPQRTRLRVEETFLSMLTERLPYIIKTYHPQKGKFDTYLLHVLQNLFIDAIRRVDKTKGGGLREIYLSELQTERKLEELTRLKAPEVETTRMREERVSAIRDGIKKLPHHFREALWMRHVEGKSVLEIAQSMRLSESSIRYRLNEGKKKLRNLLQNDERIFPD